jgi:hypothetical protein
VRAASGNEQRQGCPAKIDAIAEADAGHRHDEAALVAGGLRRNPSFMACDAPAHLRPETGPFAASRHQFDGNG